MSAPVTLRELREFYPHLFHPNQTWFDDELFMDVALEPISAMPKRAIGAKVVPDDMLDELTDAVLLAALYVQHPTDPIWNNWLWTADVDRYGQRVYVGNPNGNGFEIHRHLHLDHKWKLCLWE